MTETIRIVLADDDLSMREALGDLIGSEPDFELLGAACDTDEIIDLVARLQPDVALIDVKMPGGGGARAAREIRRSSPRTRIIALSAYEDQATVRDILRAGASGYLVKGTPPDDVVRAIRTAVHGEGTLSGSVATVVIEGFAEQLEREDVAAKDLRQRTSRIRSVLRPGGVTVVVQPVVELHSGWVKGFEALARFPQEPPDVWFEDARIVGLLEDLELAALDAAMSRFGDLPVGCSLGINLSPETVVGSRFAKVLERIPADRMVIEITEHALVGDYDLLNASLKGFRDEGGRLAVDDAGAGFASLRHILLMEPEIIKLDMTLTRGIQADGKRRALATALVSFARAIGADIVAEGIETVEELATLAELGAVYGQGYLLGRPIGPDREIPLPKRIDMRRLYGAVPSAEGVTI